MMKARELIAQLSEVDSRCLCSRVGLRLGLRACTLSVVEVQELARGEDQEYLGPFEFT